MPRRNVSSVCVQPAGIAVEIERVLKPVRIGAFLLVPAASAVRSVSETEERIADDSGRPLPWT
jgi:hypothetical protein